ncbi:MAG: UDP-glucose 4-epimerase GalE [Spirochaetaceae bacterium]|jgi:UDP-glucose 4-epimerase|nr:UDP-glucose 4-epimerase GalE [Spirochaetaceae bacterium]
MNLFVIGGAGYIGSHVVRELLDRGHAVTVYDNLSSGARENLFPEAPFIHGDIFDRKRLAEALAGALPEQEGASGFDGVIHLAAAKAAGESMIRPEKYSYHNINGTIIILNAAVGAGIQNFVFSSSAAVYGEPRYLPIDEEHPVQPENYYGYTKAVIENTLAWYEKLRGLRFASLRYFNAAGYDPQGRIPGLERQPANLIPVIMEAAIGIRKEVCIFGDDYNTPDGTCVRDYVHVSDLAAAHAAALGYISAEKKSAVLNLGSGRGLSVKEIIEAARRISGKPILSRIAGRRPGDPASLTASSRRAQEVLGWRAGQSDLDTLIRTTWEAYSLSLRLFHPLRAASGCFRCFSRR